MKTVLIAIQARSTSERLPNKALRILARKPCLQWVIEPCQYVSVYMKRDVEKLGAEVKVCLVVPKGDPIASHFQGAAEILEGDEMNVLSRYQSAADLLNADFVVRITGDCVFIPTHLIARHIKAALIKGKDYTTNVHYRTYREGWDCEVISKRLLDWLTKTAKTAYDREHVTTLIAKGKPFPFLDRGGNPEICHVINSVDESHLKTSIDTKEEFDEAEKQLLRVIEMKQEARRNGAVYV